MFLKNKKCRETAKKIKFKKHGYLIITWSDKAFKGSVVNRTLPFFQESLFEITSALNPLNQNPMRIIFALSQ